MADKLESAFKKDWVDAILAAGGYAKRLEDQHRVGLPDLLTVLPGLPLAVIEAKRFGGGFFEPRPRQWLEMDLIVKGGGDALMLGFDTKDNGRAYLSRHIKDDGHRGRVYRLMSTRQRDGETYDQLYTRFWKDEE